MSKRIKVSDLIVTERETPLIIYAEQREPSYRSGKEPKKPLLHICKRNGSRQGRMYYDIAHEECYEVTNCNHPFAWSNGYYRQELELGSYRLCARCGTQSDFEAALAKYHKVQKESREQYQQREQEKEARRQEERLALAERLSSVGIEILSHRPRSSAAKVEFVGNPLYKILVHLDGHTYEIKEVQEKGQ